MRIISGLILAAAASADAAAAPAVVPLEFIRGLPFIDVTIGAAQARMMFDSGGALGLSVAEPTIAKAGSVKLLEKTYRFMDLNGKVYEVPELEAGEVAVGAARLGTVKGRVHTKWGGGDSEGPEAELTRARESGAIGLDAFAGRPLLFDYKQLTMSIYEPGEAPELDRSQWRSLQLGYGGEGPYVTLQARGKTLKFVLDTGTPVNLVDVNAFNCGQCDRPLLGDLRDAGGQPLLVQDAERIDLGGAPFDGILGAPFFRSYRIVFDLAHRQLHISPGTP